MCTLSFSLVSVILRLVNLHHLSGPIIATSPDLTPKGSWEREILLFQGNLGWWNIVIWPDLFINNSMYLHRKQKIERWIPGLYFFFGWKCSTLQRDSFSYQKGSMICLREGSFELYSFIVIYVICIYIYIQSIKISYIYIYLYTCMYYMYYFLHIYIYICLFTVCTRIHTQFTMTSHHLTPKRS